MNIDVKRLCTYLLGLSSFNLDHRDQKLMLLSSKRTELERANNLNDIFIILKTECASFLNYHIFERLLKNFKINKKDIESLKYPEKLRDYVKKHKISEFVEIQPQLGRLTDDRKELVLVLDIESTCRLSQITDIGKAVAKIMGLKQSTLLIHNIKLSCVVVAFLLSSPVANFIFVNNKIFSKNQVENFQTLSIQKIKCNDFTFDFTLPATCIQEDTREFLATGQ